MVKPPETIARTMRPLLALLLALAALGPAASAGAITFSAPAHLGDVVLGAEPGLAIAPDGTTYMGTPTFLARSDDQGATWHHVGREYCLNSVSPATLAGAACPLSESDPGMDGAGDTALAVGPTGTLYHLGLLGSVNVPFQSSTTKGATISSAIELAPGSSPDRQWLTVGPDGALHASWRDANANGGNGAVIVRSSVDGGVTWSAAAIAANDGHEGPIAADPRGGLLYLPHVDGLALKVATSANGGASWTQRTAVAPLYQDTFDFPAVAVDANGTAYLVWDQDPHYALGHTTSDVDRPLVVPQTFVSVSRDGGAMWTAPRQVSPPGVPAVFPWIAAGSAGRVVITWYEGTAAVPSDRVPNEWHMAAAISTNADGASPTFQETLVSATPNHVGGICTEGLLCTLSAGDRSLLDLFMVGITPDGAPVIVYAGDSTAYEAYTAVFATKMTSGPNLRG